LRDENAIRHHWCRRGRSFQEFFVGEPLNEVPQDILSQSFRLPFPFLCDGHEPLPDPPAYFQFRHGWLLVLSDTHRRQQVG